MADADTGNFELNGIISDSESNDDSSISNDVPRDKSSASDRFGNENPADFIESMANTNTVRKTKFDMKNLLEFCCSRDESRPIESIPAVELNSVLQDYFINVRKRDGSEYEPSSLRCMMASFDRYLKDKHYPESLVTSDTFYGMRKALKSKQTSLKSQGKGGRPNRARSLTPDEVDIMFRKKAFSLDEPSSLLHLVYWNNCLHFGIRPGVESRSIMWGDITLHRSSSTGKEYLQHVERQTKTRQGMNCRNFRTVPAKMFQTTGEPDDSRDPVSAYKVYASKRPVGMNHADSPFYLGIRRMESAGAGPWYVNQAMGQHTLEKIMKTVCEKGGIQDAPGGKISNHSTRKTMAKTLKKAKVPDTNIAQVAGWANLQSINDYDELDLEEQETISNELSNFKKHSEGKMECANSCVSSDTSCTNEAGSKSSNVRDPLKSLFMNTHISGGTINISVNNQYLAQSKSKQLVIHSDSSQSSQSQ